MFSAKKSWSRHSLRPTQASQGQVSGLPQVNASCNDCANHLLAYEWLQSFQGSWSQVSDPVPPHVFISIINKHSSNHSNPSNYHLFPVGILCDIFVFLSCKTDKNNTQFGKFWENKVKVVVWKYFASSKGLWKLIMFGEMDVLFHYRLRCFSRFIRN